MVTILNFGLTGSVSESLSPVSTPGLAPIPGLRRITPEIGGLRSLSAKAWCVNISDGEEELTPEKLQELSWQRFFFDPTEWSDNRVSKPTARHPDFRHKISRVALWLNSRHKPAWVDSQILMWDAAMMKPPESAATSPQGQGALGRSGGPESHVDVGLCRKLCEDGRITDAVDLLNLLVQRGYHVSSNLFYCILKWCIANKDLVVGRRIHALTIKSGYEGDNFLATHLIGLYASHGRLEDAMRVFTNVSTPDSHNWASIILAYARYGEATQAICLYRQMREAGDTPTNHVYVAVLKACANARCLVAGKEVHAHILASPGEPDIFVRTGLIDMYAKCASLSDARRVFDDLPQRDVVTWNAMIAGYAQQGMGQEALNLYSSMQQEGPNQPGRVTFLCLLQACANMGVDALPQGQQIHAHIEEQALHNDMALGGSLVNMYAKCGSLEDARRVFDRLEDRDVVTWTTMIAGYAQQDMGQEALALYCSMQQEGFAAPDSFTFASLLQACASVGVGALHHGNQLYAQIEERGLQDDVVVGGSLVNMYAKCGSLEDARVIFDRLRDREVLTWTAMIAAYAQQGMGQEALTLYGSMQREGITPPDSVTFVCLLQACACIGLGALDLGKHLHAQIAELGLQDDVVLGGSLVNMYAKCGSLEDARNMFDRLQNRNVVTWNAMLGGYVEQGMGQEALTLYNGMQQSGINSPNAVTFVCLLHACAIVAALPLGEQLHVQIEERGLQADEAIGASLVNMYAKCGSIFLSQQVFDSLPERTIEAWNALISGYARQGESEVLFDLVHRMSLEGKQPDGITFLSVLTVCSHVGLVVKGRKYFEAMTTEYGISPTVEHYTCMMDLLGRAGHLDEALRMAKSMPFALYATTVWRTLLGGCRKWSNVEIGQQAFEFAVGVDAKDAASYVLMANIYASAQMWVEARDLHARRVKAEAWKKSGQSWWTDLGGDIHTFVSGDKKHPEGHSMYARLEQ